MNSPSEQTDRQIPPGAFERWLAQGHADQQKFRARRARRYFFAAALLACIGTVLWLILSSVSRGPISVLSAPQDSHERKHSESHASFLGAVTDGGARTSAEAPATLEIAEGKSPIATEKPVEKPARNSQSVTTNRRSEVTGGKISNPANEAGIAHGKPTLPEPHAILEIRDGRIFTGQNTSALPRPKAREAARKRYTVRKRHTARPRSTYSARDRRRRR